MIVIVIVHLKNVDSANMYHLLHKPIL